jgi:hypothetical protein
MFLKLVQASNNFPTTFQLTFMYYLQMAMELQQNFKDKQLTSSIFFLEFKPLKNKCRVNNKLFKNLVHTSKNTQSLTVINTTLSMFR